MPFRFTPEELAYLRGRLDAIASFFGASHQVVASATVLTVVSRCSNGQGFTAEKFVQVQDGSPFPLGRLNQEHWKILADKITCAFADNTPVIPVPSDFPRNRVRPPPPKPRSRLDRLLADDVA